MVAGGNETPSAEDVTTLLGQAGIEVNAERLTQLIGDLAGKDLAQVLAEGKEKLMVGGAAAAAAAPAAGGAAPAAAPAAKEEKPKVEEVDALDGGMDMFGGAKGGGDY